VVFFDLRNFTHFAETSEPEEVTQVLGEFHAALGRLIHQHEGTLERFTGDGAMVFFNDPVPCPDPADRAVETALAANRTVRGLAEGWRRRGFDLALGTGIAQGFATLGRIGFEDRFDYAAIGSVTNLAARLVSAAEPWQVLTTDRVLDALVRPVASPEPLGEITPKGFTHPVRLNDISKSEVARSERVLDETPQRPA
jgi:class 3 adenylate cyclase